MSTIKLSNDVKISKESLLIPLGINMQNIIASYDNQNFTYTTTDDCLFIFDGHQDSTSRYYLHIDGVLVSGQNQSYTTDEYLQFILTKGQVVQMSGNGQRKRLKFFGLK